MMRRIARLALTALVLAGALGQARAYQPGVSGWYMVGDARVAADTAGASVDGLDSEDGLAQNSPHGWLAGSHRVNGIGGWDGATGFYSADVRAPLTPGEAKTWLLYVWALPSAPAHQMGSVWGWTYVVYQRDPNVIARLEYIQRPAGVTGGPEVGTVWTEPPASLTLPYYATDDPLTSHAFRFTLTLVSEPSSLASLSLALLAAGAGVRWRRRR